MKKILSTLATFSMIAVMHTAVVQAYDTSVLGIYRSVSTGGTHTVAIRADSKLYAWGENTQGQLGISDVGDTVVVPVEVMSNVVSASAGKLHTAAITADNKLYTWGDNSSGQLGIGSVEDKNTPQYVMDNVAAVSAGNGFTMVITTDGKLYTFGENVYGQLGIGSTENKSIPQYVMDDVKAVSAGTNHALAITTDNKLYLWGRNNAGQLGDGTNTTKTSPGTFLMDNVTAASAGSNRSAAVTASGELYTWGNNTNGALGNNSTSLSRVPVKIFDSKAINVCAGSSGMIALLSDGIYAWGSNNNGQFGNGTTVSSSIPVKVMSDIATDPVLLSMGSDYGALVSDDGKLYMWGKNDKGQLGYTSSNISHYTTPSVVLNDIKLGNILEVNSITCQILDSVINCTLIFEKYKNESILVCSAVYDSGGKLKGVTWQTQELSETGITDISITNAPENIAENDKFTVFVWKSNLVPYFDAFKYTVINETSGLILEEIN